jgi:hypothetical protein
VGCCRSLLMEEELLLCFEFVMFLSGDSSSNNKYLLLEDDDSSGDDDDDDDDDDGEEEEKDEDEEGLSNDAAFSAPALKAACTRFICAFEMGYTLSDGSSACTSSIEVCRPEVEDVFHVDHSLMFTPAHSMPTFSNSMASKKA